MSDHRDPRNRKAESIPDKLVFLFLLFRDPYCLCDCVGGVEVLLRQCRVSTTKEYVFMPGIPCLSGFAFQHVVPTISPALGTT